jgi:hypothetical protein
LNSGKSAAVHDGVTAFNGAYTGRRACTTEAAAGGTSSMPKMSASSSAVLSSTPKTPLIPMVVAARVAVTATAAPLKTFPRSSRSSDAASSVDRAQLLATLGVSCGDQPIVMTVSSIAQEIMR